jgi:hypothetical protein
MYTLKKLAFTAAIFTFSIFAAANITMMAAFAEPVVEISPTCGPPEPGFNIVINANGFKANSTVAYKFVDSNSKIPLYGYFETNQTGGFNDVTFADDLLPDQYKLYFADDDNSDGVFDIGAKRIFANVSIPCP